MVRCCHISRGLTHAVASIKTGFWRERKKERATTQRHEWVCEWVSEWAEPEHDHDPWSSSWYLLSAAHLPIVSLCMCMCVFHLLLARHSLLNMFTDLCRISSFYYLFISWAALHTRTFIHMPYTYILAYFCLLFNRLLRKQLRQQSGESERERGVVGRGQ